MSTLWGRLEQSSSGVETTTDGDDWNQLSNRLRERVVESPRSPIFRHPWLLDHRQNGASTMLELEFAWLWTPETTMAFSLFMVVLSLFLCCWISHKVGELVCTTMAGIMALSLLFAVFIVFVSQWW